MKKKHDKVNNYAKYVKEMYWRVVEREKENVNTNNNNKSERITNRSLKRNSTADKVIEEKRSLSMRRAKNNRQSMNPLAPVMTD